ncbi:hypothetical protein JW890_04945 [candidate division WOR-3 bacterium]|nr:hypothetical protein [candidate division WOR-3 bacterium]
MKKILFALLLVMIFGAGFLGGILYSLVKFNRAENVISMNVGEALPLKAEQVISGLKSYLSLWKGRLEVLSGSELSDSAIADYVFGIDPVSIKGLMIGNSSERKFYPPDAVFECDTIFNGFGFTLSPFICFFGSEKNIAVLLDGSILDRRVSLQTMSSSATPFTTVIFSDSQISYSSDEGFAPDFDRIYSLSDTGSVWNEDEIEKYWKSFQFEGNQMTIVIFYKRR